MRVRGESFDRADAISGPEIFERKGKLFGFYAQPVWDYDEFHKLCPEPTPPVTAIARDGSKTADKKNPKYKEALVRYDQAFHGYYVLKTLEPSELDLSEEGVALDDPETWHRAAAVLQDQFGHYEFGRLMRFIDAANGIDAKKIELNLETFFLDADQQEATPQNQNDQSGEQESSSSGEHVNAGA